MRSNQNPPGSATRSVGQPSVERRSMVAKLGMPQLPGMSQMPVEWLDSGSWRLPSGKALAEFALQAGFLAPLLFRADGFRKSALNGSSGISGNTAQARGKQLGKGAGR